MSLLDDVSIVVTPNGYKAGTLFGAIPVPTFGSDEITNGGFATDSDWSKGGNWSIGGGVATANGNSNGNIAQSVPLTVGIAYSVTYTVVNASAGSRIGISTNATSIQIERTTDGTYTEIFTTSLTSFYIRALWNNGNPVSLDNVSVKEWVGADMDVTRATAATRVDENGLVNYAEIIGGEEVTNGDFSNDSDWTKGTGWTIGVDKAIYTGTANSNLEQGSILNSGINYILNYEVISSTLSGGIVKLSGETASAQNVLSQVAGTHSLIFTANGSSPEDFKIRIVVNTSGSYEITNISVKQVDRDNVPRIDYTGGGCPHILAEPQRTNLITYSEDFSNTIWQKQTGIVPTYNTTETLSPDGTYSATKFIGTGSTGVFKASIIVSGNISRSVYLKSVTGTTTATFKEPNTGTPSAISLTITNEWQRFEMIGDNGSSSQGLWIDDITSDGLYMWGAQVEEGSYATSYIPTIGSTVTRNQDIFTRDGIGSLINSTEGVLFLEMAALYDGSSIRLIGLNDGSDLNRVFFYFRDSSGTNPNRVRTEVISGGSSQYSSYNTIPNSGSLLDFNKIAVKWKVNDIAIWINGTEVDTDTSALAPIGLNSLDFSTASGSLPFSGKVKQLQVYDTALTDVQLAALTS